MVTTQEVIEQYDIESSAAVPIVYEGTVYDVLNVYATRVGAFDGHVGALFEQLGEVVGHAIAANERKQALMSDEVVELEFRIPEFWKAMDLQQTAAGRITIDEAVSLGEGEFILYGSVTDDALSGLRALAERIASLEDLGVRSAEAEESTYELRITEPPVLSTVAAMGGAVEETVIDGDDCQLTVHLSPSADVRELTDAIEAQFPSATLFRRRQTRRDDDNIDQGFSAVTLSDRQRTALETAYHSGFFEWPRGATGEEVADAIGIAPSTFHQHLRKAEKRVVKALLSPSDESETTEEAASD